MRALLFIAAAVAAAAATLVSLDLVADEFEFKSTPSRLSVVKTLEESRLQLGQYRLERPDVIRIAFLGDSTVVAPSKSRRPPDRLAHHLSRQDGDRHYQVAPFAFFGMFAASFYHAAEFVTAEEPDIVILTFNPISLNRRVETTFGRPELAGWTLPREIFAASRLPLHRSGLTLDEMLLYMGIVRSGLSAPWIEITEKQVRIVSGIETALSTANGPRISASSVPSPEWRLPDTERPRGTAKAIDRRYGIALEGVQVDHDTIRVLAAAVDLYRRSGAQVVVYSVPINFEHMKSVGRWNESGMRKTLESVEHAVEESGGIFVDLHQLLSDGQFKDAAGHHTEKGPLYGTDRIAHNLASVVIAIVEDSSESDR